MIPARWIRLSEIAASAREQPERDGGAVLDSACQGDAILRAEVEQLLAGANGHSLQADPASDPDATLYSANASGASERAGIAARVLAGGGDLSASNCALRAQK